MTCQHHFIMDNPVEGKIKGVCKFCGAKIVRPTRLPSVVITATLSITRYSKVDRIWNSVIESQQAEKDRENVWYEMMRTGLRLKVK